MRVHLLVTGRRGVARLHLPRCTKMNCVELAVSVVPSGLSSASGPDGDDPSVVPSGLSCDRTASPRLRSDSRAGGVQKLLNSVL